VRDSIRGALPGSDATPANSILRVLSDVMGALCHLTLQYVDWLALQLLPDTAETEWLDRHGQIWLVNADGTVGRKQATFATGTVLATGVIGSVVPLGSILHASTTTVGIVGIHNYQTTLQVFIGTGPTSIPVVALEPGTQGNLLSDSFMEFASPPAGVDTNVAVISVDGGTEPETDDELRARVLLRIRQPPMGGDAKDYVQWTLAVPGVTRAWSFPNEMGIGTCTVRFMLDDLRADQGGFPTQTDINNVATYLNTVRPVAVKDFFAVAPIPQRCDVHIYNLNPDTSDVRAAIEVNLQNIFYETQAPGQTMYAAWKSYAILTAAGVVSFDLTNNQDDIMQSPGNIGVLGDIFYAQ
jgi:uncharacterized phage protein gp47/JayE